VEILVMTLRLVVAVVSGHNVVCSDHIVCRRVTEVSE